MRLKRKSLDLTREELANRVGCSAALIRKLEAEERRPSAQIVERLADIFSIPPEERTVFLRYARGDWQSKPQEASSFAPWHPAASTAFFNIPSIPTTLFGREQDIALLLEYLANPGIRLITLTGPPGIGKTRLGLEVGRIALPYFSNGVAFIALAPLEESTLVAHSIGQTLGFVGKEGLPANRQLENGIGNKDLLLLLDDCEHLVEEVAPLVSALLAACARLKILITSREALRVPGEWIYPVQALGTPKESEMVDIGSIPQYPAMALFAERARAVRYDFALSPDNAETIARICNQIDGLPLAIELIAARIRIMSPQRLLELLTDQFVLSADGMRALPVRQKSLKNAIAWSYQLLSAEEQEAFAYLAVFPGGFTLEAAEAVLSNTPFGKSTAELITSLVDKSLLQHTVNTHGESRFEMLFVIRKFALEQLHHKGIEAEVRNGHLAYFLNLSEKGEQKIRGAAQAEWIDRLESEYDNLRAALDWCIQSQNTETALRILTALGWPWEVRGRYREGQDWLEKIRNATDIGNHLGLFAKLLNHVGRQCWTQENAVEARTLLEESQAISLSVGIEGELNLAETLNWLGLIKLFDDRDLQATKSMFEHSFALFQKWNDQRGIALSIFHLGILESASNHDEVALTLLEKSLSMHLKLGDQFFIARTSAFLGGTFMKQKNYEKSRQLFEQRLRLDQELQFWDGIADGWFDLGELFQIQNKYEQAFECYEASVAVCREHGLRKSYAYYRSGLTALHLDNYSTALQRFIYLLDLAKKSPEMEKTGPLLFGLAAVAGGMHQPDRAALLWGSGTSLLKTTGEELPEAEKQEFNRLIEEVRNQLGMAAFEEAGSRGQKMTPEQAIEYALETGL